MVRFFGRATCLNESEARTRFDQTTQNQTDQIDSNMYMCRNRMPTTIDSDCAGRHAESLKTTSIDQSFHMTRNVLCCVGTLSSFDIPIYRAVGRHNHKKKHKKKLGRQSNIAPIIKSSVKFFFLTCVTLAHLSLKCQSHNAFADSTTCIHSI